MEKGKEENKKTRAHAELGALVKAIEADLERLRESLRLGDKRKIRIDALLADLTGGRLVTDFRFDEVFPRAMRDLSDTHWTPVSVAVRAAELLAAGQKARILDVGAGCGKFCLIGALTTPATFYGVEQRAVLVDIAKSTRDLLGSERVAFSSGNMAHLDWGCFDGFYLFNPFYEHQVGNIRIDQSLTFSEDTFDDYVKIVRMKLAGLKLGTRVVTYHGFGGDLPPGYSRVVAEPALTGFIELWEKTVETPGTSTMIGPGTS